MKAELLITIGPLVLVGIILQVLPVLTRPGIYFGATVDPEFPRSNDGKRLLRSYRLQVGFWSVVAIVIAAGLAVRNLVAAQILPISMLLVATSFSYSVLLVASGFSYWLKFREVHARYGVRSPEVRQAELSPAGATAGFGSWLALPPFVAIGAVALYLHSHWNELPEHFPVHFGLHGEPNRWVERDFWGVYGSLLFGTATLLFLLVLAWVIARLSRNTVMRYVTVRSLLFLLYPLALTCIVVSLLPLWRPPAGLVPAVMLASVAIILYWSYRRISSPAARDAVPEPMNDTYWKAGMFYYNPDDPAIFVSKRVGIGYTINFANKWAWVILVGLLLTTLLPLAIRPR